MAGLRYYKMLSTDLHSAVFPFLHNTFSFLFILSYGSSLIILSRLAFILWGKFFSLNPLPGVAGTIGVAHCFWLSGS